MHPIPRAITMIVFIICAATAALAEDVWRLAGTFNGWNTNDPEWTMSATNADGQKHVLERTISPGVHRFKFVKNGDWSRGHLGRGQTARTLAEPGEDLTLRISGEALYRITLNLRGGSWFVTPIKVSRTVFEPRIIGVPVAGGSVLLDAASTLTVEHWDRSRLRVEFEGVQPSQLEEADQIGKQILIHFDTPGTTRVSATLTDEDRTISRSFDLHIEPQAMVRYAVEPDRNTIRTVILEPQGNGVSRGVLAFAQDTVITAMQVSVGSEAVSVENARVPAGTYAVEVRDGEVVTQQEPALPMLLIPGNWKRFTFTPEETVETVHLTGDFNHWALPGRPGSIEMVMRADRSFAAIVNLPLGAQRYRYFVDGEPRVPASAAASKVAGPGGGPAGVVIVGPAPNEYALPQPDSINSDAVRHDPSSALDFMPLSRALGLADISLTTLPGDARSVTLNIEVDTPDGRAKRSVPMTRSDDLAGFDRWSARAMTGEGSGGRANYTFTITDGNSSFTTPGYAVDIAPAIELPPWAMGAVWYQIFPERFRNGNPLNDPHGPAVYPMPWTADWYAISPEEEAAWRVRYGVKPDEPMPARKGGPLFNVVWDRRYGGDLQGIAEKFGYLRDLGVTAIYLNPIFEAESMHKYDATDFRHIDDNFGTPAGAGKVPERFAPPSDSHDPREWTRTPADRYFVDEFLPRAREAGLKVVLDGVFNHTGRPFFAFRDIEERGEQSPYKDWFYVKFDEQGKLKSWESWFNTGALPKFRQTPEGDLVPPVKQHIFDITRRWMDPDGDGDPSDGIDGWRLDVALDVGMPFWRDWRALVKSINPNAVIIAEIWDEADPYLTGDAFDTQMHYPFARPVVDWLGVRPGYTSQQLAAALDDAFDDAPQTNLIHQNLFGSHDTDRFVSMLQNPGRAYDDGNRPQDHDYPYRDVKPSAEIYRRSLLGVAIQALYTGAPMVYYGDEVGMWGADDPTDRKPFPWPDKGPMQNPDEEGDWDLQKQYAAWFTLRRDPAIGPILRFGSTRHLDTGSKDVFAFERRLNEKAIVAVINRGDTPFDAGPMGVIAAENSIVPPGTARWFSRR